MWRFIWRSAVFSITYLSLSFSLYAAHDETNQIIQLFKNFNENYAINLGSGYYVPYEGAKPRQVDAVRQDLYGLKGRLNDLKAVRQDLYGLKGRLNDLKMALEKANLNTILHPSGDLQIPFRIMDAYVTNFLGPQAHLMRQFYYYFTHLPADATAENVKSLVELFQPCLTTFQQIRTKFEAVSTEKIAQPSYVLSSSVADNIGALKNLIKPDEKKKQEKEERERHAQQERLKKELERLEKERKEQEQREQQERERRAQQELIAQKEREELERLEKEQKERELREQQELIARKESERLLKLEKEKQEREFLARQKLFTQVNELIDEVISKKMATKNQDTTMKGFKPALKAIEKYTNAEIENIEAIVKKSSEFVHQFYQEQSHKKEIDEERIDSLVTFFMSVYATLNDSINDESVRDVLHAFLNEIAMLDELFQKIQLEKQKVITVPPVNAPPPAEEIKVPREKNVDRSLAQKVAVGRLEESFEAWELDNYNLSLPDLKSNILSKINASFQNEKYRTIEDIDNLVDDSVEAAVAHLGTKITAKKGGELLPTMLLQAIRDDRKKLNESRVYDPTYGQIIQLSDNVKGLDLKKLPIVHLVVSEQVGDVTCASRSVINSWAVQELVAHRKQITSAAVQHKAAE